MYFTYFYTYHVDREKIPKTANKANFPGVFLLFIGEIITSINIKYYLFMPLSSKISETKNVS